MWGEDTGVRHQGNQAGGEEEGGGGADRNYRLIDYNNACLFCQRDSKSLRSPRSSSRSPRQSGHSEGVNQRFQ